ncbi:MAG: hypothetical protein IJZ53_11060 [Tyzzerella sp.]|nr:hypothetical protein [Tyzzerella sp.]
MKIYTQDRRTMVELPREVWAAQVGPDNKGLVAATSYIAPQMGYYDTFDRAKEVVKEIFDYHRNGKNSYIMPEQ